MIRSVKIRCLFNARVRISMFVSAIHRGIVSLVQRQLSYQQLRSYGEREQP